jgi:hypothetical protein
MLAATDTPSGIISPVDPVARYRRPETLGRRLVRKRRRKAPPTLPESRQSPEHRVDEYA